MMIDPEKVQLMTRIELFRQREKEAIKANRFFGSDYLGLYLFRSLIAYIVLYLLSLTFFILYHWEKLLNNITLDQLISAGKIAGVIFVLMLVLCMACSGMVYWFRYQHCRKRMKQYVRDLRKLEAYYQGDERKQTE